MSKTYLDRKKPDGSYIFISYSSLDKDAVERALSTLNDIGANFWYDINLRMGSNWLETVQEVTENRNCRGILYFVSPDFIYSEACMKEIELGETLKAQRDGFKTYYVLMGEKDCDNFKDFLDDAIRYLMNKYVSDALDRISNLKNIKEKFDKDIKYRHTAKETADSELFVSLIFNDVFLATGCASDETKKLDMLSRDGLTTNEYLIRTKLPCQIRMGRVRGWGVEWKVFAYNGNMISAILVSGELFATVSWSLAEATMSRINEDINVSTRTKSDNAQDDERRDPINNEQKQEKHFWFDEQFLECLIPNEQGGLIRFLRDVEHEKNYLQLKSALEKTPVPDLADDGYFFVRDKSGVIDFADRGSSDVYRHIIVDAYASIIPVIDIDYNKYKAYIVKWQKA